MTECKSTEIKPNRPRVLSGMRPTGKLHLGNYMGALVNWVKLQDEYDGYFFVADWHALTTDYADPSRVKLRTLDVALDWIAAGLDPERSTIFIQSHVLQHAELNLLLGMITPLGWLERVPTYKEQIENLKGKDLSTLGFLGYPLLMSCDILLYQPQFVPVGQDQVAHVELTRELARRFNSLYKTSVFPEPECLLTPTAKLTGLDGRKMSKSYGNTIGLSEDPESVRTKVIGMSTGGQRIRPTDAGDPEQCPVFDLHRIFSPSGLTEEIVAGCKGASIRCSDCKQKAAEALVGVIAPIHNKRQELESEIDQTWQMLRDQSAKAALRAEETMKQVREIFDLSHELGDVKRYFGQSEEEKQNSYDLSDFSDWMEIGADELSRELREYWKENLVPGDAALTQEAQKTFASLERELEEPLITAKKKRVLATAAREENGVFQFFIPAKSYEVWALLAWKADGRLVDIVLPQKYYAQPFAQAKKKLKKDEKIPVVLRREGDKLLLSIHEGEAFDVTELRSAYEPLR